MHLCSCLIFQPLSNIKKVFFSEVLLFIFHEFHVRFHLVVLWQVKKESHVVLQVERSLDLIHQYCFIVAYFGTAVIQKRFSY
jgi:hypothetical protein